MGSFEISNFRGCWNNRGLGFDLQELLTSWWTTTTDNRRRPSHEAENVASHKNCFVRRGWEGAGGGGYSDCSVGFHAVYCGQTVQHEWVTLSRPCRLLINSCSAFPLVELTLKSKEHSPVFDSRFSFSERIFSSSVWVRCWENHKMCTWKASVNTSVEFLLCGASKPKYDLLAVN